MKIIGLLGGMSWESTAVYYRSINQGIKKNLGDLHSAKIAMVSVDFHEIEQLQHADDWNGTARILAKAASQIEAAGADCLVIATNTMHIIADQITAAISIPLLHIAYETANKLKADQINKVGLLGTRFTMEKPFYRDRLTQQGIDVLIPDDSQRDIIHKVIYQELCLGQVRNQSRQQYLDIIQSLHNAGAEAIILGCTEIAMLITDEHTDIPLYDTTAIHAEAAVIYALEE